MNKLIAKARRVLICQTRHRMTKIRTSINHRYFFRFPYLYSKMVYAAAFGKFPNLSKPTEVCELLMKLNCKALKDENQKKLRILCADKVAVHDYVKSKGLQDILTPIYGIYNNIKEVDLNTLPDQFVLKTNFSCGQNLIIKDKNLYNINAIEELFNKWMAQPNEELLEYGEWHYTHIPRRIFAEKYLSELGESDAIIDYKFQCFNGKVYGILAITDRIPSKHYYNLDHYDTEWNRTDGIIPNEHPNRRLLPKPKCFEQMKQIAETLSSDFPYCRVDLYEIDGKVLFGEMTFTPAGNTMTYYELWMRQDMLKFYNKTKTIND